MQHRSSVRSAPSRVVGFVLAGVALLGLLVLWRAIEIFLAPDTRETAIGPLILGLLLCGAGTIGAFVVFKGMAAATTRARLSAEKPGAPWAWRDDWAAGRIKGHAKTGALVLILATVVWNAVSWPIAWVALTREADTQAIYLILLFPLVGVLLAWMAVTSWLRARAHGVSYFVLGTNPGAIGRTLEGHIETSLQSVPPDGFEVRLQCTRHQQSRRGKNRTQRTTMVWQDVVTIEPLEVQRGATGLRVPVVIELPPHVPAWSDQDSYNRVNWTLSVSASLAGPDYGESFEVPVFNTGAVPLTETERDALRSRQRARARAHMPATPPYRLIQTPDGGRIFLFEPKVSLGSSIGAIGGSVAFWAGTWWLVSRGSTIGAIVIGALAALMTIGTIIALFHRSSVTVEGETLTIRHRVFGIGPTKRLEKSRITDIRAHVVGDGNARSWQVLVHLEPGTDYSAAGQISSERDAEWVAEQIRVAVKGIV